MSLIYEYIHQCRFNIRGITATVHERGHGDEQHRYQFDKSVVTQQVWELGMPYFFDMLQVIPLEGLISLIVVSHEYRNHLTNTHGVLPVTAVSSFAD
jgi:hypothetical protein